MSENINETTRHLKFCYISLNFSESEFPLTYTLCLGPYSCIFDKLFGEVSDLKLCKNLKVMFIFNTKLVC